MALTTKEAVQLVRLLGRLAWPLDKKVFHALMPKVVTIGIELVLLDREDRVLVIPRKDAEYEGHHLPGTIMRNNESVRQALRRLVRTELRGMTVSPPTNIGWHETGPGRRRGMNDPRHQIALIWTARLLGAHSGGEGVFVPLHRLPPNTLPHHRLIIRKVRRFLRTGRPVLGS